MFLWSILVWPIVVLHDLLALPPLKMLANCHEGLYLVVGAVCG